jgi:hypothetical protein
MHSWPTDSPKFPNKTLFHFWTFEMLKAVMRIFHSDFMNSYWNQMECVLFQLSENWNYPSHIRLKNFYKIIFQTCSNIWRIHIWVFFFSEIRKWYAMLLITETSSTSVKREFSALMMLHYFRKNYLRTLDTSWISDYAEELHLNGPTY